MCRPSPIRLQESRESRGSRRPRRCGRARFPHSSTRGSHQNSIALLSPKCVTHKVIHSWTPKSSLALIARARIRSAIRAERGSRRAWCPSAHPRPPCIGHTCPPRSTSQRRVSLCLWGSAVDMDGGLHLSRANRVGAGPGPQRPSLVATEGVSSWRPRIR